MERFKFLFGEKLGHYVCGIIMYGADYCSSPFFFGMFQFLYAGFIFFEI